MSFCDDCNLKFSPKVFERHLERDHELDPCGVCARPVLQYRVTPVGNSLAFCSSACVELQRRQGRCFVCFKAPVRSPRDYACTKCRKAVAVTQREQAGIVAEIRAIERAKWLPRPYQRIDSVAWNLDGSREEGVA